MWRAELPPGQRILAALPAATSPPRVRTADWQLTLTTEDDTTCSWNWAEFRALPTEVVSLDLHSEEGWSVIDTEWQAVAVKHLFGGVPTTAAYTMVSSYAGFCANLPLEDLLEMPTWLGFGVDGHDLAAEYGGPVRLLVPHLYLWKSVSWIDAITLTTRDQPGTYERRGYHNYGDPWRQQRRQGD